MGFIFSNSYLGISYFSRNYKSSHIRGVFDVHATFKITLARAVVTFKDISIQITRDSPSATAQLMLHRLEVLDADDQKQLQCFFCKHSQEDGEQVKTSWCCTECRIAKPPCGP